MHSPELHRSENVTVEGLDEDIPLRTIRYTLLSKQHLPPPNHYTAADKPTDQAPPPVPMPIQSQTFDDHHNIFHIIIAFCLKYPNLVSGAVGIAVTLVNVRVPDNCR